MNQNTPFPLGLYIHLPFCRGKCAYCDFCSGRHSDDTVRAYFRALDAQLRTLARRHAGRAIDTVYIGGGTPTASPPELLRELIECVPRYFGLAAGAEFTVESNPETTDASRLRELRALGVNRVSIGVQSLLPHELQLLGRRHSPEQALQALEAAAEAGIADVNADLIFGLPGQSAAEAMESLDPLLARAGGLLRHISYYCLKIEPGTVLYKRYGARGCDSNHPLPGDEEQLEMYLQAVKRLKAAGFAQYEISNFAREGAECRHNLRYWTGGEYIGAGIAAHSYCDGAHYSYTRDITAFIRSGGDDAALTDERIEYDDAERLRDCVIFGLRLARGLDFEQIRAEHGVDLRPAAGALARELPEGLAEYDGGSSPRRTARLRLTPRGMFVSNSIIVRFLEMIEG